MNELLKTSPKYVTISYTFSSTKDKQLLGSSDESGLYTFLCGSGDAIPGLEAEVIDMKESETKSFVILAENAYGKHDKDLVRIVPKSALPESLVPKKGLQLTINKTSTVIVGIEKDSIVVDANHPLSGVDLHFSVTVETISDVPPQNTTHEQSSCGCGHSCGCD